MVTKIREVRLWRGLTQEDLARKTQTTAATISRWENFPSRVNVNVLENLARVLDVSPAELLAGVNQQKIKSGEVVMIQCLDSSHANPFDPALLESMTKTPAENMAMLEVKGDAMSPTLHEGDQCLVNTADRNIFAPGLYCIQMGQTAQPRRLAVNPVNGRVNILCDNHAYDDYADVEPNVIRVVGRIIWVGRRLV